MVQSDHYHVEYITNENKIDDIKAVISNPMKMNTLSISIGIMLIRNYHSGITSIVNFSFHR